MNQTDTILQMLHHVEQRVFLHANAAVGYQNELVLRVVVGGVHVVDLRIHTDG